MGFGLTFWKLNRSGTGDGTMVTYAQVRYTDLGDYVISQVGLSLAV